jgi:hypothetical protein
MRHAFKPWHRSQKQTSPRHRVVYSNQISERNYRTTTWNRQPYPTIPRLIAIPGDVNVAYRTVVDKERNRCSQMQHTQTLYIHHTRSPNEQNNNTNLTIGEWKPSPPPHWPALMNPISSAPQPHPKSCPTKQRLRPDIHDWLPKWKPAERWKETQSPRGECVREAANLEPVLAKFTHPTRNDSFVCEELWNLSCYSVLASRYRYFNLK